MSLLAELARRAVSHPHTATFVKRAVTVQNGTGDKLLVPTWGVVVVYVTVLIASVAVSLTSYMLNQVVTTLCMVESPVAAITVSPSEYEPSGKDGEKEGLLETGPTITLVHQKPITSTIRGTLRHLVANAGRWARFRGFRIHALYSILASLVATFFGGALPEVPGMIVVSAGLTGAVLANVHAAWTHKVVGMPNTQSLWQCIPSKSHWKTLAVPAAIASVMPYISLYLTAGVGMLLGLHKLENENITTCSQWMSLVGRFAATAIFAVTCTMFLCLPAMVTLVRIEASILPEDQDTIIPFDRTFGGKVVSQMMGGTGVVGFLDAWRSFNWEARRRLIKLFAKTFFVMVAILVVLGHILLFEVFAIMGPSIGAFMEWVRED
ncbi:hypothetical protein CFE70_006172 [Pyrenophora teres f. teres 0-1]|uniref:Uncharacterized protein n=2 Tax=Pyrenophora teres f. teres TaxID=97479 RepID=E3RQ60_PYRTT|nr:hypothetical protein PTT_10824 [Pyrenophora teres f. teres 0-1]KAE8838348.1 hypothetical protein HRS9139_02731 [Pyrenophora teres f. teres]KAE8844315.1 hypothetical protein PTNB85_02580 [Pyrenophora teres f. teres]KAE8847489.1 hypothetical protein HRS9122_04396 [Pyrenophora teres f. teres]KAE8866539.1 hypothetical protein PTNB29_03686 [Pyrenophora teres f. teres]